MILTCTSKTLQTLYPDGSEYVPLNYSTGITGQWQYNRIGEYKQLSIDLQSDTTMDNMFVYFNPALFDILGMASPFAPGVAPQNYWGFQLGVYSAPYSSTMTLNAQSPYPSDIIKNYDVTIKVNSNKKITIYVKYFQMYDIKGFLNPPAESNKNKLLNDTSSNTININVVGNSIYTNDNSQPGFFCLIQDPLNVVNYCQLKMDFDTYKAGFYGKNEHQAVPYFSLPQFNLFAEDETTPITTLNPGDNNQMQFVIHVPVSAPSSKTMMWMIRTDTTNNAIDVLANYEATFIDVYSGSTNKFGNKIIEPMVTPTDIGGGNYQTSFHIDKTTIAVGQKYRFIAICYRTGDDADGFQVNSFISDEFEVLPVPFSNSEKWTMEGYLIDFNSYYTGNQLTCCVEERLIALANISYGITGFSDDIFSRLGLVVPNDIRRYMTSIQVETYEDAGITRQYFDRQTMLKTSPTTYTSASGMVLYWATDSIQIEYDFRVRYEDWIQNLQTKVGSVFLGSPTSNMNWAGRQINIKFTINLFYDDYVSPFTDVIELVIVLNPHGYSAAPLSIVNTDLSPLSSYYCGATCLKAILDGTILDPEAYNLLMTAEPLPGFAPTIEENETCTGTFVALTTPKFSSQEPSFSFSEPSITNFCLDYTQFVLNTPYKLTALAKKII